MYSFLSCSDQIARIILELILNLELNLKVESKYPIGTEIDSIDLN